MKRRRHNSSDNTLKILDYLQQNIPGEKPDEEEEREEDEEREKPFNPQRPRRRF